MKLLLSYMVDIANDCEPPSMASSMKRQKPTMCYRKSLFRSGKKPAAIHRRRESHSGGWLPSPVAALSTDYVGVRPILVRESGTKNVWSKKHRLRAATQLRRLC